MNTQIKANQTTILTIFCMALAACGTLQVGVEDPSTPHRNHQVREGEPEPTSDSKPLVKTTPALQPVIAWLGHIASLEAGSAYDDYFILYPGGGGSFGLIGVSQQVNRKIETLRNTGPQEYVHLWGVLTCKGEDFGGCQILVDRIRSGTEIVEGITVDSWEGVIYSGSPEPRSGGDDTFILTGPYPVQYGIWAQDEGLRSQLEALRDTGTPIRIWGTMQVGVPDWAGTQIQVSRFETVSQANGEIPPPPEWEAPDQGWKTYTNQRYGYRIQYPPEAAITEYEVQGFPGEELPEDMSPDEFIQSLQGIYGSSLCVEIRYGLGVIYLSAPDNENFRYVTCGRTGMGAGEITEISDSITIMGTTYTSAGLELNMGGESLDLHNETLTFELPDGLRFQYGSINDPTATYEDYLMKTKAVLLEILSTYEN